MLKPNESDYDEISDFADVKEASAGFPSEVLSEEETVGKYLRNRNRFYKSWGWIGFFALLAAGVWVLNAMGSTVTILIGAAVLAFICVPIVNLLTKYRISRGWATFIALIFYLLVIVLFFMIILPPFFTQINSFIASAPTYLDQLVHSIIELEDRLGLSNSTTASDAASLLSQVGSQLITQASGLFSSLGSGSINVVFTTAGTLFKNIITGFLVIVVAFWLAKDYPAINREIGVIFGPRWGYDYALMSAVVGRSVGGYLRGLLVTSTCTGILAGIGYYILGVPYAGVLGLITMVFNVIPYIGPWLVGILAAIAGLFVSPLIALFSILVSLFAQQLTDNLITPKVMQEAVSVHPVLVILGLSAGGAIGGIVGMIAAVPLVAACKSAFVYYFEHRTLRQVVDPQGAFFRGDAFTDAVGDPISTADALGSTKLADDSVLKGMTVRSRKKKRNNNPSDITLSNDTDDKE